MSELKNDIHIVNNALAKMLNSATTWHQVKQIAEAALHAHLKYELMCKKMDRIMQENGYEEAKSE